MYSEDDFLMISGIQHYAYCSRQWALIHIEQQWSENERTIDGHLFHKNAHNADSFEKRGNLIITRGLKVKSYKYGLTGNCDIVEFHKSSNGISLFSFEDLWVPYPVEYKKGLPKENMADELQLCAQAMCLEEMLLCSISEGSLYYGENRRRTKVDFTAELRGKVQSYTQEMHDLWRKGYTPRPKIKKGCNACSIRDLCIPKLQKSQSVSEYICSLCKENENA